MAQGLRRNQHGFLSNAAGKLVGATGLDGLEYLFPAVLNSGALANEGIGAVFSGLFRSPQFPKFSAAVRARLAGQRGPAIIAVMGDSKSAGSGAGTGTFFNDDGVRRGTWWQVAALLTAAGLETSQDSFYGLRNFANIAGFMTYDTRLTGMVGWTVGTELALGGKVFVSPTNNAPQIFTPSRKADRIFVTTLVTGTDATYRVTRGNESYVVAPPASVPAPTEQVATVVFNSLSADPISIAWESGPQLKVIGGRCQGPDDVVHIANFSVGGYKTTNAVDATALYSPLPALTRYGADANFIPLGANDNTTGTSPTAANFNVNLTTLYTALYPLGDVAYIWPAASTGPGYANVATYRPQMKAVADNYLCPLFDFSVLFGGSTDTLVRVDAANFVDLVHENYAAQSAEARYLAFVLRG